MKLFIQRLFKIKTKIKINDFVVWESQGVIQWAKSRRVVHIEGDWAFCDGSLTGIPLDQLKKVK